MKSGASICARPGANSPEFSPNALAYDRGRLFVALAAVSGVAVFQVEQEKDLDIRFEGVIPVGSFPTALSYSRQAKTLFIANGRNNVTGPNAPVHSGVRPFQYIGEILGGGIEALTDAESRPVSSQAAESRRAYLRRQERGAPCTGAPPAYQVRFLRDQREPDVRSGPRRHARGKRQHRTWCSSAKRSRPTIMRLHASTSCSTTSTSTAMSALMATFGRRPPRAPNT